MKIQTVPFPRGPEETLEKVRELKPFLNKYYDEVGEGSTQTLPDQALVMFWHQATLDFIELLDDDKRVGLIMNTLYINEPTGERYANVAVAYIDPEYRGKGEFKRMLDYMTTVYQARNVKRIDINVPLDKSFCMGKPVATVYRVEI